MRILFFLFVVLFSGQVYSQSQCTAVPDTGTITMYRAGTGTSTAKLHPTKDGACRRGSIYWVQKTNNPNQCAHISDPSGSSTANIAAVTVCEFPNSCAHQCPENTECFKTYDTTTGGTSCVPECPPPTVRDPITQICVLVCDAPQILNEAETECIDPPLECDLPQVLNEAGDECIDPPLECDLPQVLNEAGDECIDPPPPECPSGQVYSALWDQCHAPCEIPGQEWAPLGGPEGSCADPNPYNCPPGTSPRDVTAGQGESDSVGLIMCVDNQETTGEPDDIEEPVTPEPPPVDCPEPDSIIGYINDQPVCGSVKESCDSVGGSLGIDAAGKPRCVPQKSINDDDAMPNCKSNETITYVSAAQEYRCKKVTDEPNTIPKSEKPPEIDTDSDGTPDQDDSDMDGDGVSNSLDDDWDGDGVPNVDDATPKGSSGSGTGLGGGEKSISGGGNCEAKPDCKGDPIECAVVFQTYKTRCAAESLIEETEDEAGDYIKWSEISDNLDDEFDGYTDSLETADEDQNTAEVGALESAISGILPDPPSCSDITINMLGYGDAVISCADLAIVRDILGWALYIFTAWYLFQLAITPIESKA